jgi:hypothetical protein
MSTNLGLALLIAMLSSSVAAQAPTDPTASRRSIDALKSLARDLAMALGKGDREVRDWLHLWGLEESEREPAVAAMAQFVRKRIELAAPQRPVFRLDWDVSNEPILIEEIGTGSACRRSYLATEPPLSVTTCCTPKQCELAGPTEVVSRVIDAGARKDAPALRALAPMEGVMKLEWTGEAPSAAAGKPDQGGAWRAEVSRRAVPRRAWHLLPPIRLNAILAFRCKPGLDGRTECCASIPMDDVCIFVRNAPTGAVVERVTTNDWTH